MVNTPGSFLGWSADPRILEHDTNPAKIESIAAGMINLVSIFLIMSPSPFFG
jgi:hypothetical protein